MPPGKPHYRHTLFYCTLASQVVLLLKNPPASAGDVRNLGSIPGYGKSPEGGHFLSTPVFFPGAWWATVHRVTKSQTQLKPLSVHACKYYSFYKLKAWQSCVKQGFWHHFSNNIFNQDIYAFRRQTGKPKNLCNSLYYNIHFIAVVWNQTCNISKVCLLSVFILN